MSPDNQTSRNMLRAQVECSYKQAESKVFDISTSSGLRAAEKYKEELYEKYANVTTVPIGLDKVKITGR